MKTSNLTATIGKTTITLNLSNTQNINDWNSMAPFTSAVLNFIEMHALPSYSYPEVYEFMVTQRDCPIEENFHGNLVFQNGFVSDTEERALCKIIKQLSKDEETFFQVKNKS